MSRTFTFLGTGTSVGVPMIGCGCAVCSSTNPKNHRTRCSVLVQLPGGNLLIDTAPYCTDVSEIPGPSWKWLEGLHVLVLDALWLRGPHPSHFNLAQALDVVAKLKPRQTYFTHMSHEMDYDTLPATLPPGVA